MSINFKEFLYKTRGGKMRVKQGTWKKVENHKIYAKWLKEKLRYENEEDWYKITAKKINDYYGGGLLREYYNNSPQQFVKEMFPHYEWKSYKFSQVPREHWDEIKNHKDFANDLGKHLGYTNMEDWYKITLQQIYDYYGCGLLSSYYNSSPQQFVNAMFPEYPWINSKFKKNYSQGQIQWLKYMCVSTPDIRHILNHDDGEYKIPGSRYYADGYSDEELCIFEYHGDYWHGNPKIYNQEEINKSTRTTFGECYEKTLKKQRLCKETGYNYVSIWESEWIRAKLAVIKIQQKWKNKKN